MVSRKNGPYSENQLVLMNNLHGTFVNFKNFHFGPIKIELSDRYAFEETSHMSLVVKYYEFCVDI
jgi:hypothetical protein